MATCLRCNEDHPEEELDLFEYCPTCHEDVFTAWPSKCNSAEAYIDAAQPVFPYKKNGK